jgi:hypothetical protein
MGCAAVCPKAAAADTGADALAFAAKFVAATDTSATAFATVFAAFATGTGADAVGAVTCASTFTSFALIFANGFAGALLAATCFGFVAFRQVAFADIIPMIAARCAHACNGRCPLGHVLATLLVLLHSFECFVVQPVAFSVGS